MIHVIGPKDPQREDAISTVSHSTTWSRGLSPFVLGPIPCYDGKIAKNMENAWQFSKVYSLHVDANGEPMDSYFQWRDRGWEDDYAHRYPAGRGARPKFSLWEGRKLTYVEARKAIYIPLYARAVVKTDAYTTLKQLYEDETELWLWDFDGYDHRKLGRTYEQVINDPNRKCGHAFVLAMLLTGLIDAAGKFVDPPSTELPL